MLRDRLISEARIGVEMADMFALSQSSHADAWRDRETNRS